MARKDDVDEREAKHMRNLVAQGMSRERVAEIVDRSVPTVRRHTRGVENPAASRKPSAEEAREIHTLAAAGMSIQGIARTLGRSRSVVRRILRDTPEPDDASIDGDRSRP